MKNSTNLIEIEYENTNKNNNILRLYTIVLIHFFN
jgi:hypothetical protein